MSTDPSYAPLGLGVGEATLLRGKPLSYFPASLRDSTTARTGCFIPKLTLMGQRPGKTIRQDHPALKGRQECAPWPSLSPFQGLEIIVRPDSQGVALGLALPALQAGRKKKRLYSAAYNMLWSVESSK